MNRFRHEHAADRGFTLPELMVTVGVIALLVLIVIPVYVSAQGTAAQNACYMNQNMLQRAAQLYPAVHLGAEVSDLAGIVDESHPIRVENIIGTTPRCPSGDTPVDPENPTLAEGAYSFDASGTLEPCTLGPLGAHGSFDD